MASVDSKNWNVTDVGDGAVTTASPAGTDARTFIVQLAPIDVMPHSVFFFLEMIRLRAWDDTFFHHQEKIEHVLTAVPMHCRTGAGKYDLLAPMGSTSLSFPEYSAEYPHEKYTLGFAYLGPHFYINSRSNVEVHGPGGQGHHTLPLDADACFGRVVDGIDVVDDLIRFGLRDGVPITMDEASAASSPWQYGTRIISIEIVPNT
jgi:cyclophilin family peptidyl-prolyl cis-trans isomerase